MSALRQNVNKLIAYSLICYGYTERQKQEIVEIIYAYSSTNASVLYNKAIGN
jgi:hypothetical protein